MTDFYPHFSGNTDCPHSLQSRRTPSLSVVPLFSKSPNIIHSFTLKFGVDFIRHNIILKSCYSMQVARVEDALPTPRKDDGNVVEKLSRKHST